MSRFGPADVNFLLVNGMDVLGDTTQVEDSREALIEETTPLGVSAETHAFIGVSRYTASQQGFYDDAANRSNAALVGLTGVKVFSLATEGNTIGKPVICSELIEVQYDRQISRGALHKANAQYLSAKGHDEAVILHALGEETADGDTDASAVDGGAQSTDGATVYLQVTDLDLGGYDDVTITVIDDADNSGTFGDLVAFTDVSAIGAERVTVAGTVERYVAVKWEFNGTGSNPSISFMVAIKRN